MSAELSVLGLCQHQLKEISEDNCLRLKMALIRVKIHLICHNSECAVLSGEHCPPGGSLLLWSYSTCSPPGLIYNVTCLTTGFIFCISRIYWLCTSWTALRSWIIAVYIVSQVLLHHHYSTRLINPKLSSNIHLKTLSTILWGDEEQGVLW